MPFSSNKLSRDTLLSRYFPHYRPVASAAYAGLSGGSCIIESHSRRLVLRQHHDVSAPESHFHRQYRALQSLPATIAPRVMGYYPGWMAVEFLDGEIRSTLPESQSVVALLYHLHQQRRFGWRVLLLPLLERYWQFSDPARRTPQWLARIKQLRNQGEPRPLRLVPLHMDVHAGNIIHTQGGLRLIDWEYAGDGDIALELAAIWVESEAQRQKLITDYAEQAQLDARLLSRQVRLWRPWVQMLIAGWYEYRWRQTGNKQFIALANDGWRQLLMKK